MQDLRRQRLRDRLREKRLEAGWTQAEAAGLHFTTISHLESGRTDPQSRSLKLLARALGCRPADLWAKGEDEDAPVRFVAPPFTTRPVDVPPLTDREGIR